MTPAQAAVVELAKRKGWGHAFAGLLFVKVLDVEPGTARAEWAAVVVRESGRVSIYLTVQNHEHLAAVCVLVSGAAREIRAVVEAS